MGTGVLTQLSLKLQNFCLVAETLAAGAFHYLVRCFIIMHFYLKIDITSCTLNISDVFSILEALIIYRGGRLRVRTSSIILFLLIWRSSETFAPVSLYIAISSLLSVL